MPAADAFLQAILDDPDDDTPRLVYADWLEEHGDPRGEFIRAQVALSRLAEDDPGRDDLKARERTLLEAHHDEWLGSVDGLIRDPLFVRGFVERGTIGTRQFLKNAARIFALVPLREVKLLRLAQTRNGAEELADCPYLERLRGLELTDSSADDGQLATLVRSPFLRRLTTLRLRATRVGEVTLNWLWGGALPDLRILDLTATTMWRSLRLLAGLVCRLHLERLDLSMCNLGAEDADRLARWPGLATLEVLNLANNTLRVGGAQHLAASPHLGHLTRLGLRNCAIGVTGARALAGSAGLAGLRTLEVSGNEIGINGLRALLESPHLPALTGLHVGSNNLGDAGVQALADWEGLARLRSLSLWNNHVGDAGLTALARSRHAVNLRELNLTFNDLTDAGLRALAESPYLEQLRDLHLSSNYRLTADGLRALLASPCLPRLKFLQIDTVPMPAAFRKELRARFDLGRQRRWPLVFGDGMEDGVSPP